MKRLLCLLGFHRWSVQHITHFRGDLLFGNCAVHEHCELCPSTRSRLMFDPDAAA